MTTVDKEFIVLFIRTNQKPYNGTFPFVNVDVSVMLVNNQTFANFVEILHAYKSKDITLFMLKNPK